MVSGALNCLYSLAVIYDMSCIPSLSSLINNVTNDAGALLIVLVHTTIQVVYCHHLLTPYVKCLWQLRFDTII